MSEFLTRLNLAKMPGNIWKLDAPLKFRSNSKGYIHIGAGFETDFSGPEIVPLRMFTNSPTQASQIVYDYLCHEWTPVAILTRIEAMRVFRECLIAEGVPAWRAWLVFLWMRTFNK